MPRCWATTTRGSPHCARRARSGKSTTGYANDLLPFALLGCQERVDSIRIVIEHVTRMHGSVAPDWPRPLGPGGCHLVIEGLPRTECHLPLSEPSAGQHGLAT